MNNEYKYYIFYINPELLDDITCIINDDTCIYAYTDDKKIADMFSYYHNDNLIRKKQILSRKEVNILARDEQNQILSLRTFITSDENGKMIKTKIPVTKQEEKHIDLTVLSTLHNLVYKYGTNSFPVAILQPEFTKLCQQLRIFSFINNYKLGKDNIQVAGNYIKIKEANTSIRLFTDEVSIYADLFKDLLNGKL